MGVSSQGLREENNKDSVPNFWSVASRMKMSAEIP